MYKSNFVLFKDKHPKTAFKFKKKTKSMFVCPFERKQLKYMLI